MGRGVAVFTWRDREAFVTECLRQGGSSDVEAERESGSLGRYARQYASAPSAAPSPIAAREGDQVTFFCNTLRGRGVHLTRVPFGTREQMDEAYALLARAGARCNDARPEEKAIAASAMARVTR